MRDVLGVLVAVQRQARHLRPLELLEQLQVDVPADWGNGTSARANADKLLMSRQLMVLLFVGFLYI